MIRGPSAIHFANQNDWGLPAVEYALLHAMAAAEAVRSEPG